ncbi:MAG: hypothetical protein LBQ59_01330 [Candidatus Peribacteria bacterium]|nr:hypothetical protein [Candidatus Peribacteria bacterium]
MVELIVVIAILAIL